MAVQRGGGNSLDAGICSPLATNRINLTLLTHIDNLDRGESCTAMCTEGAAGRAGHCLLGVQTEPRLDLELYNDISIVSIFPHNRNPRIAGAVLEALASCEVRFHGLAGSISAVSVIVPAQDMTRAIEALFTVFEFPAYRSPFEWHAAYVGQKQVLREIIASYQERVIQIYGIVLERDLGLWLPVVSGDHPGALAQTLTTLADRGIKMPFIVAQADPSRRLAFACAFPLADSAAVDPVLGALADPAASGRALPVGLFHVHGPHFGDRYGIASTLVEALEKADVQPLAIACAVSSMSVVVAQDKIDAASGAIEAAFHVPRPKPRPPHRN